MLTVSKINQVDAFMDAIMDGTAEPPTSCSKCPLYGGAPIDCTLCCHPPVTDPTTRPHWCPIRKEAK